ncbi:MAG: serine protein kinase RIO [Candidatus Hydrothermarchaeales archaeon]
MIEKDLAKLDKTIDELRKRIKGVEDVRVGSDVFDKATLLTLYEFANKGLIDTLLGVIKTGKEANVFKAIGRDETRYAVKIHRIATSDFRDMWKYIDGDHRFKKIKRTKRSIVYAWAEKEFKNLKLAHEAGVRVPKPIAVKNNVLIMEFIGNEDPSKELKDCALENPEAIFMELRDSIRKLWMRGFVHGDMSEYNVLMHHGRPVIIDISQGVIKSHPMAEELLMRDVSNLIRFFKRYFEIDEDEAYAYVTGTSPS